MLRTVTQLPYDDTGRHAPPPRKLSKGCDDLQANGESGGCASKSALQPQPRYPRYRRSSARNHSPLGTAGFGLHRTLYFSPLMLLSVAARLMKSSVLPISDRFSR